MTMLLEDPKRPLANQAVETALPAQRREVGAVILRAFASDPVARWVYPDEGDYLGCFPRFIDAFAAAAFARDTAHYAGDFDGAALWLPPGAGPDDAALMKLFRESIPRQRLEKLLALLDEMGRNHPLAPHWYLPMIAVDPGRQRCGIGSALLAHMTRQLDRQRATAYLESSNALNIPLYERHGFEVRGRIQVGDSPPLFPMVRRPRRSVL